MKRTILHIDFDSFFASCEQQFDPSLRGRPIGVTATNGRTCIIAASREAKKFGVKSVTRVWEAKKICPEILAVPAHFEKYWEITQKFLDICKDYSPYVELFSLDEVFIDLSSTENLFGGRYEIIRKIKERINEEIGEYITVSVGLSYNKLLAKLASGLNKPNARPLMPEPAQQSPDGSSRMADGHSDGRQGFVQICPQDVEKVYSRAKLTDFCGIGERIKIRLNKIGIDTPLQLRSASLDLLIQEFKDVEGHFLKSLGFGEDESEVIPYYLGSETKSVGRSYCLPRNEYDQRLILQNIYELCEEIGIKLRRLNKKARTIGLYLGGTNTFHGRKTISDHIDSGKDIYSLCKQLYEEWGLSKMSNEEGMVRQISIWTGNLEDSSNLTLSLFETANKAPKIQKVMDEINDRFGDHTIRNGFVHDAPSLKTVPNGYMADKFERQRLAQDFRDRIQN